MKGSSARPGCLWSLLEGNVAALSEDFEATYTCSGKAARGLMLRYGILQNSRALKVSPGRP